MDSQTKQALHRILRVILGALFIFSGFVKCVDPTGGAIKIEDYFVAWGWGGSPWWLCMALSVVQNIVEFTAGFMLVCGSFVPLASIVTLAFMAFFTPLTLYIAIANPVSDCGCFGDAFKITNWQTFGKNIFFLAAAIVVFLWRNIDGDGGKRWKQMAMAAMGVLVAGLVSLKGITDEPIMDFRSYAVGTDVRAAMSIPEDAPMTEYKTTFILEKDGVRKVFDENNYPYEDSTWVFIDSHSEVIKEGYVPSITDFSFVSPSGEDMSESLLSSATPVFLAIAPKIEHADRKQMAELGRQFELAQKNGFDFFLATSSSQSEFIVADSLAGVALNYLMADETMLKTIVRSNPGLIVLQNGVIVAKYNFDHLPFDADMASPAASYLSNMSLSYGWLLIVCLFLACVIVWLLLYGGKHHRCQLPKELRTDDQK